MIDAHCHLDDPRIIEFLPNVLQRARNSGVEGFLSVGTSPAGWEMQKDIARAHRDVWVAYGLHPWVVAKLNPKSLDDALLSLSNLYAAGKEVPVVGLGEIGLDRSSRVPIDSFSLQEKAFREQLSLAREHAQPVILHVVKAHNEMLRILRQDGLPPAGGMVHGFTGSVELAEEYLRLGLHLSLGGAVTRPHGRKLQATAAFIPREKLLVETDSPDQKPWGFEGPWNEPSSLPRVLEALARLRHDSVDALAICTASTFRKLFGLM